MSSNSRLGEPKLVYVVIDGGARSNACRTARQHLKWTGVELHGGILLNKYSGALATHGRNRQSLGSMILLPQREEMDHSEYELSQTDMTQVTNLDGRLADGFVAMSIHAPAHARIGLAEPTRIERAERTLSSLKRWDGEDKGR
jgi:hypothetical protein